MKKLLIATCVLLLLVMLLPAASFAKEKETKQRTVVLVYDDSGSMRNNNSAPVDRWKYASYALQSFIGLLDRDDRFSYVPMSRPSQEISVSLAERQAEMEKVRKWKEYRNTPFQAVETAINALKRQVSANPQGEFWLIVLTDGAFNELESPNSAKYEGNKKHIIETLQTFKFLMESKKASLHSVLITMEEHLSKEEQAQISTFKDIWKETTEGMIFSTTGEDGIVESVNQAAALIANRDPFSKAEEFVQTEATENKLIITTPFPSRRITIVQQGNEEISKMKAETLETEGPFIMQTPEQRLLTGSISHIKRSDNGVMKAGTYEIQFENAIVQSRHIKALVEPALNYSINVYKKEGSRLVKTNEMYTGDTAIIEAKPDQLPVNPSYFSAFIEQNGKQTEMKWNETRRSFIYEIKIGKQPARGNVSMNIKGFYRQTKEFHIDQVAKPKFSLRIKTGAWKEKVNELMKSPPIVLQPLVNGKPMTAEEVKRLRFSVTFNKHVNYELKQQDNELHFYPRPYYSDTFNFTETGTVEAAITFRDSALGKASKTIMFEIEDVSFWKRYATIFQFVIPIGFITILIFVLVIGWIVRPRFHKGSMISYELDQRLSREWVHKAEPELLRNRWWKHYFGIPYRAERRTVQSVTFIAKKGTKSIFIAKESQITGMMIDGTFLHEDEVGKEHRTLYPNESVVIERGYGKEIYRYECE
ncbi:MAG: VWA domain-containing protein [Ectobacillus sp.]